MKSALEIQEAKNVPPVLVVDADGLLGVRLAERLSTFLPVICVVPGQHKPRKNLAYIRVGKKFPKLPDLAYSTIIFFENQNTSGQIFSSLLKKTDRNRIEIIYVISLFDAHLKKILDKQEAYGNVKTLVYGDIFWEKVRKANESVVNRFLHDAHVFSRVQVEGDGTDPVFPVFIEDVILATVEASFGKHKARIFFAFPGNPPTQISLAREIKKILPEVKIDFRKAVARKVYIPTDGAHLLESRYPLLDRIKKVNLVEPIEPGLALSDQKSTRGKLTYVVLLSILFVFLLPAVLTVGTAFLGLAQIKKAASDLEEGQTDRSLRNLYLATSLFGISEKISPLLAAEASLVGKKSSVDNVVSKVRVGKEVSLALANFIESYSHIKDVLTGKSKNPPYDFSLFQTNAKEGLVGFEKVRSSGILSEEQMKTFSSLDPIMNVFSLSLPLLSDILAVSGEKKYLVLFQNNMELRPGGGFIGSFGILTLKRGEFKDFNIEDVYDADGQLKGHIEPPYPIRRFLPSEHWYLRDSNFSSDFSDSASSAMYFLNLEKKEVVDGVIAVDTFFVKSLISALGPVFVPEYNVRVTQDNFYELTEEKAQANFFPGSTQKKSFLASLHRAIETKISTEGKVPYAKILKLISDSFSEKHLLVFFKDPTFQDTLAANGLSSAVLPEETKEGQVNDYLGIIEANLGVNKVNRFVEREVRKEVLIEEDGSVLSNLEIVYINGSTDKDYKNYLRVMLPQGATITGISIDGLKQNIVSAVTNPIVYEAKDFIPPLGLEVENTQGKGKDVFGFLVICPAGKTTKVNISYQLPQIASVAEQLKYNLSLFKQPGIDSYPLYLTIDYPKTLSVIGGKNPSKNEILKDQKIEVSLGLK